MAWIMWTISTGTGGWYRTELVDDFTGLRSLLRVPHHRYTICINIRRKLLRAWLNSMDRYEIAIEHLIESMERPDKLVIAYNKYLNLLFSLSLWSSSNPHGRKIHWKDTSSAKDEMGDMSQSPGLYIFGHEDCPCLIGKTIVTLWGRLRGRYIGGERTQLELADSFADQIREAGIDGFPDEITNWREK